MESENDNEHLGWIQCTQCGNGFVVHKVEVDVGDYVDRQACDECGIGPMLIDWTWPDGPGWKNETSSS
jgi:hypothetical protein